MCNGITIQILPAIFTFVSHKPTAKTSRFCSGRDQSSLWEFRVAVDKTEGELKFPRKEQLRCLLWELSIPAVYLSWVSPSALFSSLSIGASSFSNLFPDLTTTQGFISIHQLPGGVSTLVSQRHFKTKLICFSFPFFPSVCVCFIFSAWYLVTHFNLNILFFFPVHESCSAFASLIIIVFPLVSLFCLSDIPVRWMFDLLGLSSISLNLRIFHLFVFLLYVLGNFINFFFYIKKLIFNCVHFIIQNLD